MLVSFVKNHYTNDMCSFVVVQLKFCSACAIKRYARTPKFLACGAPGGIFSRAVIGRVNKKREEREADDRGLNDEDV